MFYHNPTKRDNSTGEGVFILNNYIEQNLLLEKKLEELELSPTMFNLAKSRYTSLGVYLQKFDKSLNIYPQGSMRLGTVVRPFRGEMDAEYDIDTVLEFGKDKGNVTPEWVKQTTKEYLVVDETYKKLLDKEKKRCWTLQYAEDGNAVGFHMDILPGVKEDTKTINSIVTNGTNMYFLQKAISITQKKKDNSYEWNPSNPAGYADWFYSVNYPLKADKLRNFQSVIFNNYRGVFASIDEVPEQLVKTSLQRVIMVLKRHRDVYFSRKHNEDDKPISIIITTLATLIVQENHITTENTLELLALVSRLLLEYKDYKVNPKKTFSVNYRVLKINDSKWVIPNPVNSNENFADAWNDGTERKAKAFFEWLEAIQKDIINNISSPNFINVLIEKLALKPIKQEEKKAMPSIITACTKPYRG